MVKKSIIYLCLFITVYAQASSENNVSTNIETTDTNSTKYITSENSVTKPITDETRRAKYNALMDKNKKKSLEEEVSQTDLDKVEKLDVKTLHSKNIYVKKRDAIEHKYPPREKLNLVHIVKQVDNTTIEFWVDPYEDNVDIDMAFTNEATDCVKEKDKDKDSDSLSEVNETNSDFAKKMDTYLSNYENSHAYFYKKKYDKAHFYIDKAIAIDSKVSYGYRFKGTIYYAEKNFEGALDSWKHAVELNPSLEDVKQYINELENH